MSRPSKAIRFAVGVIVALGIGLCSALVAPAAPAYATGLVTIDSANFGRDQYGQLTFDVDVSADGFAAAQVACYALASYSCTAALLVRHGSDWSGGIKSINLSKNEPYNLSFTGSSAVRTITEYQVVFTGYIGSGTPPSVVSTPWIAWADPYPEAPVIDTAIIGVGRSASDQLTYKVDVLGAGFRMTNLACGWWAPSTNCYIQLETRTVGGAESVIAQFKSPAVYDTHAHLFESATASADIDALRVRFDALNASVPDVVGDWISVRDIDWTQTVGGGSAADKACQCAQADPVNTMTGEFYLPATDVSLSGIGPAVGISRTYSSLNAAVDGPFGYGWATSLGAKLIIDVPGDVSNPLPKEVHVVQENGATVPFSRTPAGDYEAKPWILATLTRDGSNGSWTMIRDKRETMRFDSDGRLTSMSDPRGNDVEYAYDGSGKLATIEGSGGRSITLTWSSGRITGATDSADRTVTYTYSSGKLTSVSGVDGGVWGYTYDGSRRMLTVTSPGGGITTNVYSSGRVSSQTDPVGRVTTFAYDTFATTTTLPGGSKTVERYSEGTIASITTGLGTAVEATTSFAYDPEGNRVAVTDPLGKVTTSTFDSEGNELTTTDPLDRTTTRTFDALGDVLTIEDPLGRATEMTYNAYGDLTSLTSPGGHEQTWTLNGDGTIASHTDARNKTTTYTYDSAGRQLCTTDPVGRETCVEYDARGFVVASTDAADAESEFTYDDLGRVLVATDPNGAETTTTYDDDGNPLTVEDALGNVTTMTYDDAGQLLTGTNPIGGVTTYTYSPRGEVATVTDPNGAVVTTTYDALNRVASFTDGESRTTAYAYDLAGRLLTTTRPSGAHTHSTYDDAGQLVTATDALGNDTDYEYDDAGQLVSVTDPLSRVTETSYTPDGLIDTVTYPDASTEQHEYNANGQETSFTNADGAESTYVYGDSGQLATKTEPGGLETSYTYDDAGRLEDVTTPDGHTSTRGYDDVGHLLSIDYVGATDDVDFTYDDLGQRLTMHDATGTTTYTYTDAGQVASVQNGNGQTIGYEYDDAGQLVTLTYPGGHDVVYGYDGAGQMTSVTGWASGVTEFTYTDDGYLQTREDPNGVTETRAYDATGQLTAISDATSSAFVDYGYGYGDAGQLVTTTMTDALHASTTQSWGYDPIGQLTTVSSPSGAYAATSAGLLTATPHGDASSYNAAGQLVELENVNLGLDIGYGYDGNGARASQIEDYTGAPDRTVVYTWGEAGALTGYDDGTTTTTYEVDADGLRQSRTQGATIDEFLWDTTIPIAALLDDSDYSYIYGPGIAPIAQIDGIGTVEYLYGDNLGSIRTITDDTGAVVGTTDYDPYGKIGAHTGTSGSNIGYTGAWTDPGSGLVYLRARDYDPRSSQLLSVDPIVSQTRQAYAYADNRPLLATDPLGLCIGMANTPQDRSCTASDFFWGTSIFDSESNQKMFYAASSGFNDGATFGITEALRSESELCALRSNWVYHAEKVIGTVVMTAATFGVGAEIGALVKTGTGVVDGFQGLNTAIKAGSASAATRTPLSGSEIAEEVAGLKPGSRSNYFEAPTENDLLEMWNRFRTGGISETATGYPGTVVRLADGTTVGLRISTSYGTTLDINVGGNYMRVHFSDG